MEPKDFFRVILRRKRTVITAITIVMAAALFGSMRKEPTYAADCRLLIQAVAGDPADKSRLSIEAFSSFETMREFIQSPVIAQRVAARLQMPVERVLGKVSATLVEGTEIFQIRATNGDPVLVSRLCNATIEEFIASRRDFADAYVKRNIALLDARMRITRQQAADLDRRIAVLKREGRSDYLDLEVQRNALLADLADDTQLRGRMKSIPIDGGGRVLAPAPPRGVRAGPDHRRDGILGLLVGLIFGAAMALVREYMDDTVRDKETAQRDLGLPVLASMPSEAKVDGYVDPTSASVEAARVLRANLASIGFPHEVRALVVTSTLAKRRSTTLVNFAAAIAEAGRTVLVIGSDFRNPRTHEVFGVGNTVGLTNVIRGQIAFERAIRQAPGMEGVYVMPTGPSVSNPSELLSSEGMGAVLRRARRWADAVLVDAPPVLSAADASILGAYADGVLLVMSAGQTLRAQANEAKDQLGAAGARLLGMVLFGANDQNGGGKGLMLRRRDGGDDDLPPLMPFGGAWGGPDWDAPVIDIDLPSRRSPPGRSKGSGSRAKGSRSGGKGNAKTARANGKRTVAATARVRSGSRKPRSEERGAHGKARPARRAASMWDVGGDA